MSKDKAVDNDKYFLVRTGKKLELLKKTLEGKTVNEVHTMSNSEPDTYAVTFTDGSGFIGKLTVDYVKSDYTDYGKE